MKIRQLRSEIDIYLPNILSEKGFIHKGELGEFYKVLKNKNTFAVLIDSVKDGNSFSISIRVFIRFHGIEKIFDLQESEYTLNKYLAAETVCFDYYSKDKLKEILNNLISEADSFFTEYGKDENIIKNLNSSDYKILVSSDKVTIFKVRLASAVMSKNTEYLQSVKDEAMKYCSKEWSEYNREIIKKLCLSV